VARKGYRIQPRVSTLGIVHQELRALKGAQIERPNMAKRGPMVQLSHVPIAHSDFCATTGASFIWYPHLSPPSAPPTRRSGVFPTRRYEVTPCKGEPLILRVPRVETLGLSPVAPAGQALGPYRPSCSF
jgi:hypothetical protein